jgi:hypothetical protein
MSGIPDRARRTAVLPFASAVRIPNLLPQGRDGAACAV